MVVSAWSTHQVAEFVAAVSAAESESSAAIAAVERAADAFDADVAAIVCGGEVVVAVGYAEGTAPVAELAQVRPGVAGSRLDVPGVGTCPADAAALEHPPGATLVVARPDALTREETSLLRGMASVASMTMRMLRLLDDERAARQELERTQAELTASRARIITTADETRRRIERDLHDGAQQRLVSLLLQLRAAQDLVPPECHELAVELDRVAADLTGALDELHEFARGIHPAILAAGGLRPALRALARRSVIPVDLDVRMQGRLPERVEIAAYYAVSEALTNAAKHAHATNVAITVDVEVGDDVLRICVRDDGVGGADPARGSGLVGLTDRVEALGGRIAVRSDPGHGTTLVLELPVPHEEEGSGPRGMRSDGR
jgi:signal transduction histidine kinase